MTLLTAEDVLNKKFQPTKFREGYDQDEVDDFLDDVVSTLRALTTENEQLRANLAAAQARINELESAAPALGGAPAAAAAAAAPPEPEAEPERATAPEPTPEPELVEVEAEAEGTPAAVAVPQAPAAPAEGGPQSAAGMLALAQRVHDEYVANGQMESERLVSEARATADGLVQEAEQQRSETLGRLERERAELEQRIDELRAFERDYRDRLKTYLEGLLQDIEGADVGAAGTRTIA